MAASPTSRPSSAKTRRMSPLAQVGMSIESLGLGMHLSTKITDDPEKNYTTDSSLGYGTLPRKKSSTGSRYSTGSWSRSSSRCSSKRSSRASLGDISASESSEGGALSPRARMATSRPRSASGSSTASASLTSLDHEGRKLHFSDAEARRFSAYWSQSGDESGADVQYSEQERELEEAFIELQIEKSRTAEMASKLQEQERERLVFACRALHEMDAMRKEIEKLYRASNANEMAPGMSPLPTGIGASWKRKASLPLPLEFPSSALWNGDVLVGGHLSDQGCAVLLRYSVSSDTWSSVPVGEWLRIDSVFSHDRQLYVMTQNDISTPGDIYRFQQTCGEDGVETTWEHVTSLPSAHNLGSAACIGGQLIVTGGLHSSENRYNAAVDVYDVASCQWSCLPNLKTKRCLHHTIGLPDNRVFIYGGTCSGGAGESCEVEQIDLDEPENWEHAMTLPHLASSLAVSSSVLFSSGGLRECGGQMKPSDQCCTWLTVDPASQQADSWISLPALGVARAHVTMCFVSSRSVMAIGGVHAMSAAGADSWSIVVEEITIP